MQRKVLYITGVGRSGSTLLGLILGHGPDCFVAGELYGMFWPRRPFHRMQEGCFCDRKDCTFWSQVKSGGVRNAYENIFDMTGAKYLIDGSKHPVWLKRQLIYGKNKEYKVDPGVIYKTPTEFAKSLDKRGQLDRWRAMWVRRHKWIFDIAKDFVSVKYKNLTGQAHKCIQKLCEAKELPYFDKKSEFWNNDEIDHYLFGSDTAKSAEKIISYEDLYPEKDLRAISSKIEVDKEVERILRVLDHKNVLGDDHSMEPSEANRMMDELGGVDFPLLAYRTIKSTRFYFLNRMFHNIAK